MERSPLLEAMHVGTCWHPHSKDNTGYGFDTVGALNVLSATWRSSWIGLRSAMK